MYLFEHDCKNGVRAGRGIVHFGGGSGTRGVTETHIAEKFVIVFDGKVGEVFDVGALGGMFTDFEIVWVVGAGGTGWCKEVSNMFVVDFKV